MSEACILAHLETNVPPRARHWSLPDPDQSLSDRSGHRPALLPPGQPVFSRRTLRKAREVPMVQMGKLRLREAESLNQGVQTHPPRSRSACGASVSHESGSRVTVCPWGQCREGAAHRGGSGSPRQGERDAADQGPFSPGPPAAPPCPQNSQVSCPGWGAGPLLLRPTGVENCSPAAGSH